MFGPWKIIWKQYCSPSSANSEKIVDFDKFDGICKTTLSQQKKMFKLFKVSKARNVKKWPNFKGSHLLYSLQELSCLAVPCLLSFQNKTIDFLLTRTISSGSSCWLHLSYSNTLKIIERLKFSKKILSYLLKEEKDKFKSFD